MPYEADIKGIALGHYVVDIVSVSGSNRVVAQTIRGHVDALPDKASLMKWIKTQMQAIKDSHKSGSVDTEIGKTLTESDLGVT